jgi:hypothetical protein
MTRLPFGGGNTIPVWSPDGRYIVLQAAGGIFWTRSDGVPSCSSSIRGLMISLLTANA